MSKTLLITGATGNQGRGVINALLASPKSAKDYIVLAVTRNPSSAAAKALVTKFPSVHLIQGNLDDCPAIFQRASSELSSISTGNGKVWGVFSVQVPFGGRQNIESEERQGKSLVDAAIEYGVRHFVYTSVDRRGDDPTYVPYFITKHRIEKHLKERVAIVNAATANQQEHMTFTILRPTGFMENVSHRWQNKLIISVWKTATPGNRKVQCISTNDIGHFAAESFRNPLDESYRDRAIGLAGDNLSLDEINGLFRRITGAPMPAAPGFLGKVLCWLVPDLAIMWKWYDEVGCKSFGFFLMLGVHPP